MLEPENIDENYNGSTVAGVCPRTGEPYHRPSHTAFNCVPGRCACGWGQATPDDGPEADEQPKKPRSAKAKTTGAF